MDQKKCQSFGQTNLDVIAEDEFYFFGGWPANKFSRPFIKGKMSQKYFCGNIH